MYTVAYENNDIVIRFEKKPIDKKALANFLEFIEFEQIRKNSKLSEQEAEKIAKEINSTVWSKLKNDVL